MTAQVEIRSEVELGKPTPIRVQAPDTLPPGPLELRPCEGGAPIAAQSDGDALVAIVGAWPAATVRRYNVAEASEQVPGVVLRPGATTLELQLPQGPLGAYHYGRELARPYLWPLLGPGQLPVTRAFPMAEQEGDQPDHPHHRSLWTAFGEVNDVDNWSEQAGHGYTRHVGFDRLDQGPVFGGFAARSVWTSRDDAPVLDELLRLRLYNVGPERRLFDYTLTLQAAYGDVVFDDTKEAGIIAVRVAGTMDGVAIENSRGDHGEAQCWGRRAAWCDYSGPVQGQTMGIAILDHPSSANHPPRWHVRDYGLFAVNPFSSAGFGVGEPTPYTLSSRDSVTFSYRVLVHRGDAGVGGVAQAYAAFAGG